MRQQPEDGDCAAPDPVPSDDPGPEPALADSDFPGSRTMFYLTLLALIAGIAAGFTGGAFRWVLLKADAWRESFAAWATQHGWWGPLVMIMVAAGAAALGAWIGTRWPMSAGSGIQQVEAVERGEDDAARPSTIPARFIGGALSIGVGGMVLGREGPTVHMGATFGALAGRIGRAARDEIRVLQTCLSGAGLAVAFNAPIGGAVFVFEEVAHKIRVRYLVWTMVAVAAAISCSRIVLGNHPDFTVALVPDPGTEYLPLFAAFGVFTGLLGTAYNLVVTRLHAAIGDLRLPAVVKGAAIGVLIGVALVYLPEIVGGGDDVAQSLLDGRNLAFWTLTLYLVLRFFSGPVSYAAGTPGGLFAPMLAHWAPLAVCSSPASPTSSGFPSTTTFGWS
ncbi:putative ClC chloride channel [Gordonia hirsuta DSM 44140 = NBRC 16056]|uniref:Putative ClC chloride channel n=1 Tax=Gordonia hirsuta DSM 44140 = NBRC 16056 TaxID=1121927 RepID=L7L569_9ACTN|nr:chloride channel protein [Gordonia hirsuta]GAC56074.1 putative ClC chloride channel [Gordonia hirsuta DSM 44140 = NBRC 16056]